MSLWIIILAYLIAHLYGRFWRLQQRQLIRKVMQLSCRLFELIQIGDRKINSILAPLLTILLMVVVQLSLKSHSTVAWFVFSTVILVISLGSRDLDQDVKDYLEAEDDQQRDSNAEQLAFDYRHPNARHDHEAVIKGIFYQSLVRWFGVIFWFLVFGAAGAIGFRLVHSQMSDSKIRARLNSAQLGLAKQIIGWIDLLPAVLATIVIALIGDFERVISAWRQHFVSQSKSVLTWDYAFFPCVGYEIVMAGDPMEEAFEHDYKDQKQLAQVNAAMSLVWRSVACWLTMIALLILLDWLN